MNIRRFWRKLRRELGLLIIDWQPRLALRIAGVAMIAGAADKPIRIGPIALTNTLTTNIVNPPVQAAAGVNVGAQNIYLIITHIRISNKTAGGVSFSLWVGATGANAAGTEFWGTAKNVPANDGVDWYGRLRLDPADFLVGGASANTSLTFEAEGYLAVA